MASALLPERAVKIFSSTQRTLLMCLSTLSMRETKYSSRLEAALKVQKLRKSPEHSTFYFQRAHDGIRVLFGLAALLIMERVAECFITTVMGDTRSLCP